MKTLVKPIKTFMSDQNQDLPNGQIELHQNGSNLIMETTMQPISKKRLQWVSDRLEVLAEMIYEFSTRQQSYQYSTHMTAVHPQVMTEIRVEQLKLLLERKILSEMLQKVDEN